MAFRGLLPFLMCLVSVAFGGGCTCAGEVPPPPPGVIACRPQHPTRATVSGAAPEVETVSAGTVPVRFSVTSTGEAAVVMPLITPPGRGQPGAEPQMAITVSSAGGDGVLGHGVSLTGSSVISRRPMNLARDGEIREVQFNDTDSLELDGRPLVIVGSEPGRIEYRTVPDTRVRVIGHDPDEGGMPRWFEGSLPSGIVIEYGTSEATRPRGPGGVPRAWLAAVTRDGRGNATDFLYCFAEADGYTTEFALDEIRYTRFDGPPAVAASRAVKLVYGTKDPAAIRRSYSRGMALQHSLQLDAIEMVGPGEELVRRYAFSYELSPATSRTLLKQVKECAGDGVCKPPTRFRYQHREPGFKERATSIAAPTARKASPALIDVDGDGLDDLLVPDVDEALSTPQNPITRWRLAHNDGPSASGGASLGSPALAFSQEWVFVDSPDVTSDPALIRPEVGTVLDYDDDGRKDVLLHDIYAVTPTWEVLLAQPNRTFTLHDTGLARPFPLKAKPSPGTLSNGHGSAHLADVDGDHVPDLIQCTDHGDPAVPSTSVWRVHLWRPAQGGDAAGFLPEGEIIEPLRATHCGTELHTVDLNRDGKVELVVAQVLVFGDGTEVPAAHYYALSRSSDGGWEASNTHLPVTGGRVLFMDSSGDGLPDAVVSSFQDHALRTYTNTGIRFAEKPVMSLGGPGLGNQDQYVHLAAPLDWNGDGRMDLLMPVPPGTATNASNVLPAWSILQAKDGDQSEATFTPVDANIPFEAELGEAITLADPHGPRVGDLNGDGAPDIVLPLGGVFHVFENLAPDQDVLIAVSDGMNEHEWDDAAFVPNVAIAYGHMVDPSITSGVAPDDPSMESALYLSRFDPSNGCSYPRRCAVGPRRVVSGYALNDGSGGKRHYAMRYRDGRYDCLGFGYIGLGQRLITDLDTLAGSAETFDNITFDEELKAYPFAGQVKGQWRWNPGLPSQPKPEQIELSFLDITPTLVPTNDGKTYFTIPTHSRLRRLEGVYSPGGPTLESYVRKVESSGGVKLLRDTTAKVTDFDAFGNVLTEEVSTVGVDLTLQVDRSFKNDTDRWVLGQLQTQTECSAAAMQSQCRTLTRTTTIYGEIDTASMETSDGSPETKLKVTYGRDAFGNVTSITADDAFGHHRATAITYDIEGIFPESYTNAAGHTSLTEFDARFGALAKLADPNGLVTEWKRDGFGRLGLEKRPDGTETSISLARTKKAGAWRLTERTTTSGGADDAVEYDSLGRPIRWLWHGPTPQGTADEPPRLVQEVSYDPRSGKVARRSVPVSEGTPESKLLFDEYAFDALGREVRHTTPWNAVVQTAYSGLFVHVTDPLESVTSTEHDPLGRPVAITDAAKGLTSYVHGPYGDLYKVTGPGGAVTTTTRDALGRVKVLDDPDRGMTIHVWNGFGELLSSTDALGRITTFEYDDLGRTESRVDQQKGVAPQTTIWTWDTAANGLGKLHKLTSPDGEKSLSYNKLGQLEGLMLTVTGANANLEGKLSYDPSGRVETITYPTPAGAPAFVVTQDYDRFGHVLKVHDGITTYWHLTDVDDAGRFRKEVLGNDVVTERSYFADKQLLKSIVTSGATMVQSLAYEYDARLSLTSRTDALQAQHKTERFRYDALDRLRCAYFSALESPAAPCATGYDYAPNGNVIFKSDVGVLSYTDPAHPHAVTAAGGESYGYNAVGNQVARPGGVTVAYTPFDLPTTIKQGALTLASFGYDGDEKRIRKTTPAEETLYFEELYERVTKKASATTEHRYYIHSPERVVAVVTRGGDKPGTLYLHTDNLGSVDVLTNAKGGIEERRSYDPWGQRRNPIWGQPPPASFSSKTTKGFTGHEDDDELGLVNMRGRILDPKLGRFLTMDPIVSRPRSGQSWNPYSYTANNPLSFIDPSGFSEEPADGPGLAPGTYRRVAPDGEPEIVVVGRKKESNETSAAAEVGAAAPPTDVDTTGSSAGYEAQATTTAPEDWTQNPYVQVEGGFLAGLSLGIVPFGGVGQQVFDAVDVLPHGTPEARRGLAVGQIVGGLISMAGGITGNVLGGLATTTGIGAAIGVPAVAVSTSLVIGGASNVAAGLWGLAQSMMSKGSGSTGPSAASPIKGGDPGTRPSQPFTKAGKEEVWSRNAAKNGGTNKCETCDLEAIKPQQHTRGVRPPGNEGHVDHMTARSKGGSGTVDNGQLLCRNCNLEKSSK